MKGNEVTGGITAKYKAPEANLRRMMGITTQDLYQLKKAALEACGLTSLSGEFSRLMNHSFGFNLRSTFRGQKKKKKEL